MDIAASCTGHVYILPDGSDPPLRNSLHNYGNNNYNNIIIILLLNSYSVFV